MITEEKVKALDAFDLAKEIVLSDTDRWQENVRMIHRVNPEKLRKMIGFLSLEGGSRWIRIYALETPCIPRHFLRSASWDRDPEIRKRALELLKGRRPKFRI